MSMSDVVTMYVAVRRCPNDGPEWMDIDTLGGNQNDVKRRITRTDKSIPDWAKHNPVQRIAEVEIREV